MPMVRATPGSPHHASSLPVGTLLHIYPDFAEAAGGHLWVVVKQLGQAESAAPHSDTTPLHTYLKCIDTPAEIWFPSDTLLRYWYLAGQDKEEPSDV